MRLPCWFAGMSGRCAFESMETVFVLLSIAIVMIVIQGALTLVRSLGAGPEGGTCWTPNVYLPLADRAFISRCPRIETPGAVSNNTFLINDECGVRVLEREYFSIDEVLTHSSAFALQLRTIVFFCKLLLLAHAHAQTKTPTHTFTRTSLLALLM